MNLRACLALLAVAIPLGVAADGKLGPAGEGRYKLKAWSERTKTPITQEITLRPGANTVNVGVAGDAPTGSQPDKFGGTRG
jgi:hypothetical protein